VVVFTVITALSCSGGGGSTSSAGTTGATGSNYEGPGLVLYTDTINGAIVAADLNRTQVWRLKFESFEQFVSAIECSRDGTRAAYVTHDTQAQTASVRMTTPAGERVTRVDGVISGVAWSPDGASLAVTRTNFETLIHELLLIEVDSGEQRSLLSGSGTIGAPRWSPDGSSITFDSAAPEERNQILVYRLGEAAATPISTTVQDPSSPDWSPAGQTIVFAAPADTGQAQLFTVPPAGGQTAQITTSNSDKTSPRWSLDGSLVAYVGTIPLPPVSRKLAALRHNVAVWTANPDGANETAFTDLTLDAWLIGWCAPGPWLDQGWERE
jgi:dipeptidyl aminopeptidase/acylaminoacyl peptidase